MNAIQKYKILYVDDEPINLEAFRYAFVFDKRFEIITAISGKEGLKIIEQEKGINVIISDMMMPEMDGIVFIKKAKEIKKNLVCFILSGYVETREAKEAKQQEIIIDYIMKPYDKEELEERLINAINKNEQN